MKKNKKNKKKSMQLQNKSENLEFIYDEFVHSLRLKLNNLSERQITDAKQMCFHLLNEGFASEFPRYLFIARQYPSRVGGKFCTVLLEAYDTFMEFPDVVTVNYNKIVELCAFI